MGRADLRQADLRQADLRLASLEGARLVGADLRGALLFGARLGGAVLDWRYSVIPLELLRQDRGASQQGSKLVADLAFEDETRPFAWLKVVVRHRAAAEWAFGVLSRHIREGDNAPELLRKLTADAVQETRPAESSPMLWTRRLKENPSPRLVSQAQAAGALPGPGPTRPSPGLNEREVAPHDP